MRAPRSMYSTEPCTTIQYWTIGHERVFSCSFVINSIYSHSLQCGCQYLVLQARSPEYAQVQNREQQAGKWDIQPDNIQPSPTPTWSLKLCQMLRGYLTLSTGSPRRHLTSAKSSPTTQDMIWYLDSGGERADTRLIFTDTHSQV